MAKMTTDQIQAELYEHKNILERVNSEVEHWLKVNKKDFENHLPVAANSRGIHGVFQTYQMDLQTFINYEIATVQPHEWFVIYKGRKNMRVFIDIVNMFEAQLNHLSTISKRFNEAIEEKVKPLFESVEQSWIDPEKKIKGGMDKADVIKIVEFKKHESSFRRRVLSNLKWITTEEFNLLEFCWWLRNCMHNDFSALSDKEFVFSDPETGEVHNLAFTKGKIIKMHSRIVYGLARMIGRILYSIIERV